MSRENLRTVKPSLFRIGEGCQDRAKANPVENGRGFNDGLSGHRHGVVRGQRTGDDSSGITHASQGRVAATDAKPQGGNLSPLLANIHLHDLDHKVNDDPSLRARLVRYADDLVILCRTGSSAALYQRVKAYLERRGLKLNEAKRGCVQAEQEGFKFLGFEITW